MKGSLKTLFSDNSIKLTAIASIFLILFQGILSLVFFQKLPILVPLLNSQPWGVGRLYPSWTVLLICPLLIFTFVVNNLLSAVFYKKNTLVSRVLIFNGFLFVLLATIAFIQILFLVF